MKYVPLYTFMPYAMDLNFGKACNDVMELLPEDGWACIIDHDMMFTTSYWYRQLQEVISAHPEAGAFAACTNRIASPWQRVDNALPEGTNPDDVREHRLVGEQRAHQNRTLLDITDTKGFGGVVTIVSKAAWKKAGGYGDGLYCVDHSLFFKLRTHGYRIYLIESLYVFHLRGSSGRRPPLVAPTVPGCPCRGVEKMPTERIAI